MINNKKEVMATQIKKKSLSQNIILGLLSFSFVIFWTLLSHKIFQNIVAERTCAIIVNMFNENEHLKFIVLVEPYFLCRFVFFLLLPKTSRKKGRNRI